VSDGWTLHTLLDDMAGRGDAPALAAVHGDDLRTVSYAEVVDTVRRLAGGLVRAGVEPGEPVYAGQIVGEHARAGDLDVNVTRNKAHSNVRESNKEQTVVLKAVRRLGLEEALEYVEDDELVEVTPGAIRLRKRLLDATARKREDRRRKSGA